MNELYIIKDRLNEALQYRNYNASQLAEKSGLNKSTISRYLNGERIPRSDAIEKMASALNVNPAWLIGYNVPMIEAVDYLAEVSENKALIEKLTPANPKRLVEYIEFLLSKQKEGEDDKSEV